MVEVVIGMTPNLVLEDDAGGVERCAGQGALVAPLVDERLPRFAMS